MRSPRLVLLSEPAGFVDVLSILVSRPRVHGPVVHDALIAALCLAHGVDALLSRDRDFALFPELTVENPFA
jgi:predicted nucleic acid-binding protein